MGMLSGKKSIGEISQIMTRPVRMIFRIHTAISSKMESILKIPAWAFPKLTSWRHRRSPKCPLGGVANGTRAGKRHGWVGSSNSRNSRCQNQMGRILHLWKAAETRNLPLNPAVQMPMRFPEPPRMPPNCRRKVVSSSKHDQLLILAKSATCRRLP